MEKRQVVRMSKGNAPARTANEREERGEVIPRLSTLRRINPEYRYLLPLHIMKRYHCIVVGGKRGMLTVALTETKNEHIVSYLHQHTGCAIFTVLIEPERMRLLLQRAEWSMHNKEGVRRSNPLFHPLLLRSLPLLSYNIK